MKRKRSQARPDVVRGVAVVHPNVNIVFPPMTTRTPISYPSSSNSSSNPGVLLNTRALRSTGVLSNTGGVLSSSTTNARASPAPAAPPVPVPVPHPIPEVGGSRGEAKAPEPPEAPKALKAPISSSRTVMKHPADRAYTPPRPGTDSTLCIDLPTGISLSGIAFPGNSSSYMKWRRYHTCTESEYAVCH